MDLCERIAECIAENEGTRQALRDFITSDDDISNYFTEIVEGLTTEQVGGKIITGSCDPSVIAGKVIAIVERMNTINEDALQIIEVGTNDEEKIANLLEGIPVIGVLPIDDIFEFLQDILEDFAENYVAAVTEEWKDEVEEDLYCLALAQPDCELTYEHLFNYFQTRAVSGLTILSTLQDVITFIKEGDFPTDDLVASGMYAMQLGFLRTGREFFGMDLPRIGAITRDALPSSAWEDWEDCEAPEIRTPVINSQWDPPNIAGTLSGPDMDGFYTVTATDRTTDFAFVLMDVDDRQFVLTDISFTFRPQCEVLYDNPTLLYIGCSGAQVYTNQTVTEYWSTWTTAQGVQSMQFKMTPP